jgi:hypothetical protein
MKSHTITPERRQAIVKDLLLRKPKGESGQNPAYNIIEYYCYDARKHKKRVECSHSGWGYADVTLWDLNFRCYADVENYLFDKFYKSDETIQSYYLTSGQRGGLTRKSNRVWNRISEPIRRTVSSGSIRGLYKVRVQWGTDFFFFGDSVSEIEVLAETMLKPIYPEESFGISFVGRSVPGDILDKNVACFENHTRKIERIREDAKKRLTDAQRMEEQLDYVKTLITQNLEVAMRAN